MIQWRTGDGKNDAEWCVFKGDVCVASCSTEHGLHLIVAREIANGMSDVANLKAERDSLRTALQLLYSWANNWDSEFMNDPDWKNRDVLIIQEALAKGK